MKLPDFYKLGIPSLDGQHQVLFEMIDNLRNSPQQGEAHALRILALTASLEEYISFHFSLEEDFMARYKYPEINEHRAEHDNFRESIRILEKRRGHPRAINQALDMLETWLVEHIGITDRAFGDHLKSVNANVQ